MTSNIHMHNHDWDRSSPKHHKTFELTSQTPSLLDNYLNFNSHGYCNLIEKTDTSLGLNIKKHANTMSLMVIILPQIFHFTAFQINEPFYFYSYSHKLFLQTLLIFQVRTNQHVCLLFLRSKRKKICFMC